MDEQAKSSWVENIFFCDSLGWGVREVGVGNIRELKTVCLGEEADIRKGLLGNGLEPYSKPL